MDKISCWRSGPCSKRSFHQRSCMGRAAQVKGVATSPGARPWQETDLQQHTWDQFLKACS